MNSTERSGKERMRRSSIPMLLPYGSDGSMGVATSTVQVTYFFIATRCDILVLLHYMYIKSSIYYKSEK